MKLELSLHASSLKNVAGAFKGTSDPFAVVTQVASTKGAQPKVLGKTEVVKNSLNPEWVKIFEIDHELGSPVNIVVSIYDEVQKSDNKFMGSAVFDVDELLGARGNTKAKKLKNQGTLFATVRKAKGSGLLRLKLRGIKLKNVEGWVGKSDPFFELSRKTDTAGGQTWDNVYRSEKVKNNLNPEWQVATVELSKLCGGDVEAPIKVAVFDYESKGGHVAMGSFETTAKGLVEGFQSKHEFTLVQKGKNVGFVAVDHASLSGVGEELSERLAAVNISSESQSSGDDYNFVDYVSGGCELRVMVAIDFTGSNGDPRQPGTLHYLHREEPKLRNDYEKAIASIVSILGKYDKDKMFPVVGFGAKQDGVVNHCFQCGPSAEVHGVDGVLGAYTETFSSGIIMSGPTVFTEVIETAAVMAQSAFDKASETKSQAYTILLIITDGAVSDPQATAEAIRRVSGVPLSVVIVGVGDADFSAMEFLDDLKGNGQRDIVQFVEFNKHNQSSAQLTRETLLEIPNQLVGFFKSRGIAPLPQVETLEKDIVAEEEEEEIDLSLDINEDEIVVTGGGYQGIDGFNASR